MLFSYTFIMCHVSLKHFDLFVYYIIPRKKNIYIYMIHAFWNFKFWVQVKWRKRKRGNQERRIENKEINKHTNKQTNFLSTVLSTDFLILCSSLFMQGEISFVPAQKFVFPQFFSSAFLKGLIILISTPICQMKGRGILIIIYLHGSTLRTCHKKYILWNT